MFFTFIYICIWIFFGIASNVVAEKKGWEYSDSGPFDLNIDWVFFTFWIGPWTFLVLCAIPPRWSIPEDQGKYLKTISAERRKIEERQKLGFIARQGLQFLDLIINSLKAILFWSIMLMFPLLQICLILNFGFDWFGFTWSDVGKSLEIFLANNP